MSTDPNHDASNIHNTIPYTEPRSYNRITNTTQNMYTPITPAAPVQIPRVSELLDPVSNTRRGVFAPRPGEGGKRRHTRRRTSKRRRSKKRNTYRK